MKEFSMCCKAEAIEDYKNNWQDHHDPIAIYTCSKCHKECDQVLDRVELKQTKHQKVYSQIHNEMFNADSFILNTLGVAWRGNMIIEDLVTIY